MTALLPRLSQNRAAVWMAVVVVAASLIMLPFAFGMFGNAFVRALAFALLYIMLALGLNIVTYGMRFRPSGLGLGVSKACLSILPTPLATFRMKLKSYPALAKFPIISAAWCQ